MKKNWQKLVVATIKEITDLNFPHVLTIDSPKIMEIRKSLGLPPKIKGYDFHITVAVK
ncbi:MAG: hypothetical protein HZB76_07105 [Chlamydiae bacterium]|nr:hypothetical protein [Chlamydiota bacterium]